MNFSSKNPRKTLIFWLKDSVKDFFDYINVVIATILLTLVYVIGVGLTFVFSRLVGKRFLDLDINKKTGTYWTAFEATEKIKKNIYRQF